MKNTLKNFFIAKLKIWRPWKKIIIVKFSVKKFLSRFPVFDHDMK